MFVLPDSYELTDCTTNQKVPARIVRLTRDLAKTKITAVWWTRLGVSRTQRSQEPDHHWNWTKNVGERRQQPYTECGAVQTVDGDVQAAIIYRVDAVSVLDRDELGQPLPAVYCEFLATAPRNRPRLVAFPRYRGAGTGLLLRAMVHSYSLGFGGRINLASLPHPDTEAFYTSFGFLRTGESADDMMIYEMRPPQAQEKLKKAGWLS
jgi:hypothetical protein